MDKMTQRMGSKFQQALTRTMLWKHFLCTWWFGEWFWQALILVKYDSLGGYLRLLTCLHLQQTMYSASFPFRSDSGQWRELALAITMLKWNKQDCTTICYCSMSHLVTTCELPSQNTHVHRNGILLFARENPPGWAHKQLEFPICYKCCNNCSR